jgi:hypothetical protein
LGPTDNSARFRNQVNVPSGVFGLDWNRGRFAHSGRFGYQKLVNSINPLVDDTLAVPFHLQLGSFEAGPSNLGPRQTVQRDLFGRYDGSTQFHERHTFRFGGAIHHIEQGDFYSPGIFGPSVTSSNGIDVINAINGDPTLSGGADNPLNYPVGTITIYNGLGNFSEHSAFNRVYQVVETRARFQHPRERGGVSGSLLHGAGRQVERGLKWTGVDLGQHIPCLDDLAFREIDLVELAIDPDLDGHRVEGLDGAEAGQVHGDVLALRNTDGSGNRRCIELRIFGLRGGYGTAHEVQSDAHGGCHHDDRNYQDPTLAHIILPNLPRGARRPRMRAEPRTGPVFALAALKLGI